MCLSRIIKTTHQEYRLCSLPDEVWAHVLNNLNLKGMVWFGQTCKQAHFVFWNHVPDNAFDTATRWITRRVPHAIDIPTRAVSAIVVLNIFQQTKSLETIIQDLENIKSPLLKNKKFILDLTAKANPNNVGALLDVLVNYSPELLYNPEILDSLPSKALKNA